MKVHRHVARTLAVAALSLVAFAGSASATSISIVNGSFEEGIDPDPYVGFTTVGTGVTGADIDGWKVTGSIDYIGTYWQAADGNRSLDMNGYFAAGRVEQDIYVPENGNVSVRFAMAGNVDDAPTVKELRVSLESTSLYQDFTFNITGHTKTNMGWVYYTANFAGITTGTYTLAFASINDPDGAWGAALDNVSASVPDGGATATLLGVALAGLGFLRRKQS